MFKGLEYEDRVREFSLERRRLQGTAFPYFKVAYKRDFLQRHVGIGEGGMALR